MHKPRQLILDVGDAGPDIEPVLATLERRFEVVRGSSRPVRRTWLDTFDWRLHRRGWRLEYVEAHAARTVTLHDADGGRLEHAGAELDWPALVDAISEPELRKRLAPVVGIRALLPVAESSGQVRELTLLNRDQKTIARVEVDEAGTAGGKDTAAALRLTVTPLRGYDAQADRAVRLLCTAPGVSHSESSPYETALARASRSPADSAPTEGSALSPSKPAVTAIVDVLAGFLRDLETNTPGLLADIDTEFLHDFRVAVRRTRSTLRLAGHALPATMTRRFRAEFRWLGDMTTPTRDLDVHLLDLETVAGWVSDARALEPFRDHLQAQRDVSRRKLVRGLGSARFQLLVEQWAGALAQARRPPHAGEHPSTAELAAACTARAYRRVVKLGSSIGADSPAGDLHALRKRGKELRYVLEIFGSLHNPLDHRRATRDLKSLQDCLGRFQDTEVQRNAIGGFAEQMRAAGTAPTATLLALGEAMAHLEADQRRARDEFDDRFAGFMRRGNERRMRTLVAVESR